MKILQINTEKTWRGGERQTLYTLRGLKKKGIHVELLCLKGYPLYIRALKEDIPVHGVIDNLRALMFLFKEGEKYDVLHCQTARAQTLAVLSKPFHSRPVVYTRRVDFKPSGLLSKLKYRATDKVIAISEKIRTIISELKSSDQIEVIPSAIEERELNKERALLLLRHHRLKSDLNIKDKKVLATMAALVPHKDPLTMIEAIRLLSKIRDDFVFFHFGEGELRKMVEDKIKEYGLQDKYYLMGFHEDVEDFFSIIDVFIMASSQEGLGSAVLDAFLYRVPVVSTDAGGLRETVEGRGLLCPVKDAGCLARSINKLLEDSGLREYLVEKAYRDVKDIYSIEKMVEGYLKVFYSLKVGKDSV